MRTLAIDTATEACSVALFEESRLIAGDFRMLRRGHAECLLPMIAALPDKGAAERIVVSHGPGSFTGLRVGLAAARGLALAWNARLFGYSALALVAAMARTASGKLDVGVAMTGGHGEWFVEQFDNNGHSLAPFASLSPQAAAAAISAGTVAGSQAEALVMQRGWGTAHPIWPDARQLTLLHDAQLHWSPAPQYGRAPDARLPQESAD